MMGHREKMSGGMEVDTFSRWRRYMKKRAGRFKRVKTMFSRRVRREARAALLKAGRQHGRR
jgi:hypothetical protein